MSDAALPCEASAAAADNRARAIFDQQLWVLGRLAQAGLNMALAMEAQAISLHPEVAADQGPQPYGAVVAAPVSLDFLPPGPGELALAFTRVSRAVRMTLALQARLLKDGPGAKSPAPAPAETRVQRASRADAIMRRLIAQSETDVFEAAELMDRARERLFDPDITGDLLDRPIPELIAEICRDLGLEPNWAQVEGEAWMAQALARPAVAKAEEAASTPSSPGALAPPGEMRGEARGGVYRATG